VNVLLNEDVLRLTSCRIGTNAGVDGGDLTNHQGETNAVPATNIGELGEDDLGGVARSQDPDADDDL
jgi:hypothetical protein